MTGEDARRIITFYSYKGGTGRTMALANTAWILASAGMTVSAAPRAKPSTPSRPGS